MAPAHWARFEIDVLAASPGLKTSGSGFSFLAHKGFAEARTYDAIWVPGGEPAALAGIIDDPARTYLDFLTEQASRARMMCSVCDGAMLLAAAGLLDGYQATTHWAFTSCFPQRFPKVLVTPGHPRFVHDRNRLTAGGVASGLDAALKLIELLGDKVDPNRNKPDYPTIQSYQQGRLILTKRSEPIPDNAIMVASAGPGEKLHLGDGHYLVVPLQPDQ